MSPIRVLVVDDNLMNRKLVAAVLEFAEMEVDEAESAEAAVVLLANRLPDLILMDIALPGIDGLDFTRQLKADPRTAGIVIVALTAFAMKGDEQKARAAGCTGYVTKPVDTRLLPQLVRDFIAQADRSPPV